MSFDLAMSTLAKDEKIAPSVNVSILKVCAMIETRPPLFWRRFATFSTVAAAMLLLTVLLEPLIIAEQIDDELAIVYLDDELDEVEDE